MSTSNFHTHVTPGAQVTSQPRGYRLAIPGSQGRRYLLAQLDDYTSLSRKNFPHDSAHFRLQARVSDEKLSGTWGFGVWNDPFGLNLGFTGSATRWPALPNAAWFFHASPHNYLSFQDDKPAQGLLAQSFRSPIFDWRLIRVAINLPFRRKEARQLLSSVIAEDSVKINTQVTHWQTYELNWSPNGTRFNLNGQVVLETSISPVAPLGMVIWMDNQFAAFTPQGRLGFGVEDHPVPAWMEIAELEISHD